MINEKTGAGGHFFQTAMYSICNSHAQEITSNRLLRYHINAYLTLSLPSPLSLPFLQIQIVFVNRHACIFYLNFNLLIHLRHSDMEKTYVVVTLSSFHYICPNTLQ